ncbi:uncharacterized protein HKW66_Vig0225230 [Vigna angularis]|uniref:Uncharacterized protein n=1 Tax=Phaseolus angularis TaxID=3914 RepID=A0A8T0K1N2_PHAAN|nr:uncharacterized protein HKW66_Vig0225230 [Vigna angularis]
MVSGCQTTNVYTPFHFSDLLPFHGPTSSSSLVLSVLLPPCSPILPSVLSLLLPPCSPILPLSSLPFFPSVTTVASSVDASSAATSAATSATTASIGEPSVVAASAAAGSVALDPLVQIAMAKPLQIGEPSAVATSAADGSVALDPPPPFFPCISSSSSIAPDPPSFIYSCSSASSSYLIRCRSLTMLDL